MYNCLSRCEVLYLILFASSLEKSLHVRNPCVFSAVLGYWSKKRHFFSSFLLYSNLVFQLCNLLLSLLFLNKFNFFKVIHVTIKCVLGTCISKSREASGAVLKFLTANLLCLKSCNVLFPGAAKVMGQSVFWPAYLQDKGSVKMLKAPGKIPAALNGNFAINFKDK